MPPHSSTPVPSNTSCPIKKVIRLVKHQVVKKEDKIAKQEAIEDAVDLLLSASKHELKCINEDTVWLLVTHLNGN